MSASLESLISQIPQRRDQASAVGGLLAFIAIGGAGAAAFVMLSTFAIWLQTGLPNWVVNTASYACLILPVYLLHRRYSFASDVEHRRALPRYVAVQAMALVLAALFSMLMHGPLGLPALPASMLVIALTSGINFMILRSWAFARSQWSQPASS